MLLVLVLSSKAQMSTDFSNFTFYDSISTIDDLHYDYGWTRSSSNVSIQSNRMTVEPVTSNVPESFTTGTFNLSGTDSIKFSHRITNTGGSGSKTLVVKLIDIMTNAITVIDTIHYANASQQSFESKTLNVSQVGLFRIQFEYVNTNIVGSSPQVIVNSFFSSSSPMMLTMYLDKINAVLLGSDVVINWESFSEEHVKSYELEYAVNSLEFKRAGIVVSKGNSLNSVKYEFVHFGFGNDNLSNVLYYRIKILDEEGDFKYSKTIELICNSKPKPNQINFVNPIAELMSIQTVDPSSFSRIDIKDYQGRVVITGQNNLNQTDFHINTISLVPGNYYLCLNFKDGSVETHKLIKL